MHTGSVYDDPLLSEIMPGEVACNRRVTLIKAHPHTHGFLKPPNPIGLGDKFFQTDNNKCSKGSIKSFERGIWLIRDPFESIWSEYQRRFVQITELPKDIDHKLNSHVKGINVNDFDFQSWYVHAADLAHKYLRMWVDYGDMKSSYGAHNILVIRYENLKNDTRKIAELQRISEFLHIHTTIERLNCAYLMATQAKRDGANVNTKRVKRDEMNSSASVTNTMMMTKEGAYTEELVCEMWQLFGQSASDAGYKPFGNYDCVDYLPIRRPLLKDGDEQDLSKIRIEAGVLAVGKRRKSTMINTTSPSIA